MSEERMTLKCVDEIRAAVVREAVEKYGPKVMALVVGRENGVSVGGEPTTIWGHLRPGHVGTARDVLACLVALTEGRPWPPTEER